MDVHARESRLASLRRAAEIAGLAGVDLVEPRDAYVTVRGLRLHYLDWGGPSDAPVLFVHGRGLTAHTFDLVCLALGGSFRCLSLDLRGHGDSEWSPTGEYSIDALSEDLAAFADALGIRKLAVVGMSLGGAAALHYAALRADAVAALAVVDIGPDPQPGSRVREFMALPSELDSIEDFVARAKAFNPRRDEDVLRVSLMHNLRRTDSGKWAWKWDPRAGPPDLTHLHQRAELLWADVALVRCPVLVIRGSYSQVLTDERAQEFANRLVNGRWTRIDGAGHNVQGDRPKELAAALRDFLTNVSS
jgi:esterase